MRTHKIRLLLAGLFILFSTGFSTADNHSKDAIKIGVISEHNVWAQMAINQRRGVDLAVKHINENGGVLSGRKLSTIHRDGGSGTPADVLRDVEELVQREGVRILAGTGPDNIGLAVSDYAKRNKIFFIKGVNGTNKHIWEEGHKYAFRFDVPNYMYGAVFAKAAAESGAKTWALVAPDYEFGRSIVADFQKALTEINPDVEFVETQWFPTFKIDAGSVVQAVSRAEPEGILFAGFGGDAVEFVREGTKRGLFKDRTSIGVLTGQPEQLESFGAEAPIGWITQGYPYDEIEAPGHKAFLDAYRAAYDADPGWFSFVGYNMMLSIAAAIDTAESTDPGKIAEAMAGLDVETTAGSIHYRAIDRQSNLGLWLGTIDVKDGVPFLKDWQYKSGDDYFPGDDYVRARQAKGR